jgi:hypothetical protein
LVKPIEEYYYSSFDGMFEEERVIDWFEEEGWN